jgi:hypothetical protein
VPKKPVIVVKPKTVSKVTKKTAIPVKSDAKKERMHLNPIQTKTEKEPSFRKW